MTVRLLGLSGSIRRGSHCTAILRTLQDAVAPAAVMTIFGLEHIPPYNEDDEGEGAHGSVAGLKAAIAAADALVVVSPEYNHGIPGVLKNAIDWASRPMEGCVLAGKPVSVMTAAPSPLGGARAQAQLRETFAATASRVMANRQVVIGGVGTKIKDGRLVDQPTLAFALAAIDVLLAEVRMLRTAE